MIFPALGPQYIDQNDTGLVGFMQQFYSDAITTMQAYWAEADTNNRFYVGDQTIYSNLYGGIAVNRQRDFYFNRVRRIINSIDGHQRKNRKSTVVVPVENGDSVTADQLTKTMLWIYNNDNISETQSEAFKGALISGMNLLQLWVDYRSDPVNGDIRVDNCAYNTFVIDPYFRKPDLSDCRALWKRTFVTKKQALSLLPGREHDIVNLAGSWANGDGKFQFMPEQYNTGYKNLLTYDEFYYSDYRDQKLLVDRQSGDTMEWRQDDEDALRAFLAQFPTVTLIEQSIPTVRLGIVLQGQVVYDGPQPTGLDSYPFVPIYAYYNPQLPYYQDRIQGVVTDLRTPQYLYNRRRVIELDILESQVTSGWIFKENALVNPSDVYQQVGQGKGVAIKEEAQMSDVQRIEAPQIPPSMLAISESLGKEITEVSGINEELLGNASQDVAGFLAALRASSSLTTYQGIFDQLDLSQKLLGEKILQVVQLNFTPGKIKRILEGQEPTPEFYNKNFGKYNAAIEEGLNTITQRQMAFGQMLQLRQAGIPIPDEALLETCTLQNKSKVIEDMKQMQQQQMQMQQQQLQIQQQQAQVAMQEAQARIQLAQARAQADIGLGVERISRVEENKALAIERKAEARKDDDAALLNMAKALKEIESVDLANLEKLIALARIVNANNMPLNTVDMPLNSSPDASQGEAAVDRGNNLGLI
jgi:hypothetical protein